MVNLIYPYCKNNIGHLDQFLLDDVDHLTYIEMHEGHTRTTSLTNMLLNMCPLTHLLFSECTVYSVHCTL